ncbi:MAG: hypothetical protein KGO02_02885 [Alphaproteobacteria bacterium]|nr:hypothetical protein [Alphaproteobacteria bacterium]
MAMYEALSGGEARRAAIMGAASVALPEEDFLLFQAVDKVLTPSRRVRNKFAHHIWGASTELPNRLLLIDPEALREFEVQKAGEKYGVQPEYDPFDRSRILVWKRADLEEVRTAAHAGLVILGELYHGLAESYPDVAISVQGRQQLLSRPAIEQAFQQMCRQRTPATPQPKHGKKRSSRT